MLLGYPITNRNREMSEKTGSMDRRARRSRNAIFSAFEALLSEKGYSSISVSDIIDRADIGRSTFYAHFPTKDALLDELCRDIFQHVLSPQEEKGHSFSADSPEDQLVHALYHLEEQRKRLDPLFRSPSSRLFWEAFQTEIDRYFLQMLRASVEPKPGIPDDLYAHWLATSYSEIVQWWFEQGLSCSPEDVIKMYIALAAPRFQTDGA